MDHVNAEKLKLKLPTLNDGSDRRRQTNLWTTVKIKLNGLLIFTYTLKIYDSIYRDAFAWYNNLYLRYFYESTLFSHLLSPINKISIFKSCFVGNYFVVFNVVRYVPPNRYGFQGLEF